MVAAVWIVVELFVGLGLLVAGGELLVRGASGFAAVFRVSPLIIGLTVVAFGTSSPELAVSLQASWNGSGDVAVGNVVGSNIFNILLILGVSALIVPLQVSLRLIRLEVPLMIFASLLMLALSWNGQLGQLEGLLLVTCLVIYTSWTIFQGRKESQTEESPDSFKKPSALMIAGYLFFILAGLGLLALGSNSLVGGAVSLAKSLGVNSLIIGLTIVAAGTSLPELVTSVVAAYRGQRDIAVGNVIGSNLFNLFGVLGVASLANTNGIQVAESAISFDIPVMIAVAIACLPIFKSGQVISRWEGGLFLFYYLAYTTYLVLDASGSVYSQTFYWVLLAFIVPVTAIALAITAWPIRRKSV